MNGEFPRAILPQRFHQEPPNRVTCGDVNEERAVEWQRPPDDKSGNEKHCCPRCFIELGWISLLPHAADVGKVYSERRMTFAPRAASVHETPDARERHADHDRYSGNVPECSEWNVENIEKGDRRRNGEKNPT